MILVSAEEGRKLSARCARCHLPFAACLVRILDDNGFEVMMTKA
jgi:hypothetical protein